MRVENISWLSNLSHRNILDIHFTCAAWPVSCLVGNIKETFSHNRAQSEILFLDFLLQVSKTGVSSFKDSNLLNPSALVTVLIVHRIVLFGPGLLLPRWRTEKHARGRCQLFYNL